MKQYIAEVSRTPLLKKREEIPLIKKAQQGCIQSRNHLVRANLRLVMYVAKRLAIYCTQSFNHEDLIAEGNLGLFDAIDRFDTTRDVSFSTYAFYWIFQYCQKGLSQQGQTIRVPATTLFENKNNPKAMAARSFEPLTDNISYDEDFEKIDVQDDIAVMLKAMRKLSLLDQQVLKDRYFRHRSLQDIGKDLQITRQRVSQIEHRAIKRLRKLFHDIP